MAIFATDLQALIYIIIIIIGFIFLNKITTLCLNLTNRLTIKQKNKFTYMLHVFSIVFVVYLLIEGFPSFSQMDPEYSAIITGAISTALAFAISGVFANFMAGILLLIVDPYDIGDIVKINDQKGIIKSIKLTRVVLETFDHIIIELSNKEVVKSRILNYTIQLDGVKNYNQFKKKVFAPQDIGNARLDMENICEKDKVDEEMIALYNKIKKEDIKVVHSFYFKMQYSYDKFRIKADKTDNLCLKYEDIFGFKPRFHIMELGYEIGVKFRLISTDAYKLLKNQRQFAKEIYEIIMS